MISSVNGSGNSLWPGPGAAACCPVVCRHGGRRDRRLLSAMARDQAGQIALAAVARGNLACRIRLVVDPSPFSGWAYLRRVSDSGTVFEIGFATALGRPVWGFNAAGLYQEKVATHYGLSTDRGFPMACKDGYAVESFSEPLNLMLAIPVKLRDTWQDVLDEITVPGMMCGPRD